MFGPVTIPFGAKLLFNTIKLKPGVTLDDIEVALAEMCSVVKDTYGDDKGGFIAGQVFRSAGFVSDEGSVGHGGRAGDHDAVIATYWRSFEQHERSHADTVFKQKFARARRVVQRDAGAGLRHVVARRAGEALSPPLRAYIFTITCRGTV